MPVLTRALIAFALAIYDRPWPAMVVWLGALLIGALQLPHLPLDASLEGILGEHAPEVRASESVADRFGRDASIVIAFGAQDVLAPAALQRLDRLVQDLRALPDAPEIVSVLDAPLVQSRGQRLQVDHALRPWPDDPQELAARAAALRDCTACRSGWVSTDASLALVGLFTPDGAPRQDAATRAAVAARNRALLVGVNEVLDAHRAPEIRLGISGSAAMVDSLHGELTANLFGFIVGAALASTLLLWVLFRSMAGVVIPAMAMVSPLVITLATMAALDVPLQLVSDALAPLIIVVSIAGTVHVLTALDRERADGGSDRDALASTLGRKSEALVLSALTTSGALLALAFAGLEPLVDIGLFGALGTAVGAVSSLMVVPALLRLRPWTPMTQARGLHVSRFAPALDRLADLAVHRTRWVLGGSALLLGLTLALASQLHFVHAPLAWLPDAWPVRQGTEWIDEATHASVSLHLVLDAGAPQAARSPEFLARVAAFQAAIPDTLEDGLRIGAVSSVVDAIDMVQTGLGEADSATSPARRTERNLRLLELADPTGMSRLMSPDGRQATVLIRTEVAEASRYVALMDLTRRLAAHHLGEGVTIEEGGLVPIFARTLQALQTSTVRSYGLALGVLLLALVYLVRSPWLGALAMLPNLLPVSVVAAAMWIWQIPLDAFTMLTVSLAIGLVVDDTLHLISQLRRAMDEHEGDIDTACRAALQDSGPAMLVTTFVLVSGWVVLLQSDLRSVSMFGWLGSVTLLVGLAADLLVAPALFVAWARAWPRR